MKRRMKHPCFCASEPRQTSAVATSVLLLVLAGCGSSGSDSTPGLESRKAAVGTALAGGQGAILAKGESAGGARSGQTASAGQTSERKAPPPPPIPETVATDLSSPDARTRYHALDYWESKGTKAPVDPLFEALEDEDDRVRAKATAIVNKYWAEEQERERKERGESAQDMREPSDDSD